MEAIHKQREFADFGDDQARTVRATDYTDELFAAEGKSFRAYYICLAGGRCKHSVRDDDPQ